jgi:hypothetical protein
MRRALCILLLPLTLSLTGCATSFAPPAAQTGAPDEALQGHAAWCGTNPPSGYCGIDDKR